MDFLFLIAWVDGSESSIVSHTEVHSQDDLETQFKTKNPFVLSIHISFNDGWATLCDDAEELETALEEIASAYGYKEAFNENYTAHDSVSTTVKWDDSFPIPSKTIYL